MTGVQCNLYQNKKVLCFILARGGSKGVPRKNAKIIGGKPLIAHSIDVAKESKYVDEIYISTEDPEIKNISLQHSAKVIDRPIELATDSASYLEAVHHMLNLIPSIQENPLIVLLESTSPIRESLDIERCIELYDEKIDCVASVREVKVFPAYMYKEKNGYLFPYENSPEIKNRQEMEKLYAYTGSILVTMANILKNQQKIVFGGKIKGYVIDELHSIDIDTQLDFDICDFLMGRNI